MTNKNLADVIFQESEPSPFETAEPGTYKWANAIEGRMENIAEEIAKAVEGPFEGKVWKTLSKIDCSKMIEKKGRLSYLSWASAWHVLMENYPESTFRFDDPKEYPDGTQEVWCYVTVKAGESASERFMWLPVLDHTNKPIRSPNAFQINTTRMRCLTKCLAMFGLGSHVYRGEDSPHPEQDAPAVGEKRDTRATTAALDGVTIDTQARDEYRAGIQSAIYNDDIPGLRQLLDELADDADMKIAVWGELNSKDRKMIKDLPNAPD